jgi:glutamine phosphoribosylpyrophosphate amidotransferase
MCSIIGFKGEYNEELLEKIFFNSRIRGLHSFGYSYYDLQGLKTKKFLDYDLFLKSINKNAPNLFVAHFRYSTSGDYKILENNQPLVENNTSICFNGVISQKSKDEMELEYQMKLQSDNDGFILLNNYENEDFIKKNNISFACVGLKENKMFALRNNKRPLYIFTDEKNTIICSTKDILDRSGLKYSKELKPILKYEL